MDYSTYLNDAKIRSGKAGAYKNYLVKNIEVIGQRKLVVIGGAEDRAVLNETIDQLRRKSVKVPEIAYVATIEEDKATEDGSVRFIDELKGKASSLYVLILAPYYSAEVQLAAMDRVMGTSAAIAYALKNVCGYTERDFCEMNEPTGLGFNMANKKISGAIAADSKKYAALEAGTASQLSSYKDKMRRERCFILGNTSSKLDELNSMMNERTFAADGFCDFFSRTPQRPAYYLLTEASAYLGNGKYIEGMECFINGNVRVFEDKFKKKPTYLNPLGKGLIDGLPTFDTAESMYDTSKIMPLYQMIQLAIYMGFTEIYIYGFDGTFELEIDADGIGRKPAEGCVTGFPDKAKQILDRVRAYADGNDIKIYSLCETSGLSMFEKAKYEDIDFTKSSIFNKI
ncbi:MAG: hypothetical protein E7478_01980 [Ruminococcaceae bacterium]|nr:hypothetical protein [Oscillospiraceae bacterium]